MYVSSGFTYETTLGKRYKVQAAVITFEEGDWGTGMGGN